MPDRGIFITFEGGEGSGKSTQSRMLAEHLRRCGYVVRQPREPGGTSIGERIRAIVLDREATQMDPVCELMLYEAARAQIVSELIEPALAAGEVVICDRFADSTTAYQGYGRGIDAATIEQVNAVAMGGLVPDRTVLLVVGVDEGLDRAVAVGEGQADRMEAAGHEFHVRVVEGFEKIAAANPKRVRRVATKDDFGETAADVWSAVADLFPGTPAPNGGACW